MQIVLLKKELIYFTFSFIILTIIGTLSHEFGHIIVAKYLNYETVLHYSSMEWHNNYKNNIVDIYIQNQYYIENKLPFKNSIYYYENIKKINSDELLILLGGVLQTTITGSLAFILVLILNIKEKNNILKWILIFLSLFWSRQVFNLSKGFIYSFLNKNTSYFWGDEQKISNILNLYEGTFSLILGLIGIIVLFFIYFKIIDYKYRFTFIASTFLGSFLGYVIWMIILGPLFLP